jgi:hypothetical protein
MHRPLSDDEDDDDGGTLHSSTGLAGGRIRLLMAQAPRPRNRGRSPPRDRLIPTQPKVGDPLLTAGAPSAIDWPLVEPEGEGRPGEGTSIPLLPATTFVGQPRDGLEGFHLAIRPQGGAGDVVAAAGRLQMPWDPPSQPQRAPGPLGTGTYSATNLPRLLDVKGGRAGGGWPGRGRGLCG